MNAREKGPELIRVERLTRRFTMDDRDVVALDEVDLTVYRGEILGIIGSSGAGKSTLLQLLGALDRVSSGRIVFEGRDVAAMSERELADFRARRVGFVFQASNLLPEFSAEENVALVSMIGGATRRVALDQARSMLSAVGLADRLSHRPGKLSGGEQQRVAIARALVNNPTLVLADEPTGNLDTHTGREIMNLITRLSRERDQTFVIVTHNMALTKEMTRVMKIQDGKFVDTLDDVLE